MFRNCLIAALSVLITGCSSTDGLVPPEENSGDYLRLSLVMSEASRAESHPDETALDAENGVSDITVFFFNGAAGVNSAAITPFFKAIYVDKGFIRTANSIKVDVPIGEEYEFLDGDRIAVAVNMGDLSGFASLGDLQQHIPAAAWQSLSQGSPSGCSRFTMASAYDTDGAIYRQPDIDGKKRYTASASVERTCARIDLGYDAAQEKAAYIEYSSTAKGNGIAENGRVHLYGLSPVNAMQQPSYALKRVSNGLSDDYSCFDTWHYTGTLPKDGARPAAYVIEPHTAAKTARAAVAADWYGGTAASTLSKSAWDSGLNIATLLRDDKIKFAADGGRAVVVSYTNENTQHYSAHSEKWLTGLLLRAVFVPKTVYSDGSATTPAAYTAGQTFYRYRPTDSSTSEDERVLYFASADAASAYSAAHPADGAEITEYAQGRCFYHMWLRHTVEERDPAIVFPMEYGIVRNHVYRVRFNFHGAGTPTPDIEGPENAEAAIYVRPWNVFRHEQIIL